MRNMKTASAKNRIMKFMLCTFAMVFGAGAASECESGDTVKLPEPRLSGPVSVEKALSERRSVRSYRKDPLTLEEVSQLLWAAQGITNERGYRTAPSGGALYPLELYVALGNVEDVTGGLYRYVPRGHEIVRIKSGDIISDLCKASHNQSCIGEGAIVLVFSSVWERITKKYGERGKRYAVIEIGHASQNVYLQAESLGLGTVAVGAFRDDEVKKVVGMKKGEDPLYMMPVGRK